MIGNAANEHELREGLWPALNGLCQLHGRTGLASCPAGGCEAV
jgi:hypothetical protein